MKCLFLISLVAVVLCAPLGCTNYVKLDKATCAQACLASTIGICPTSIIVKTGGLHTGTCAALGFTKAAGKKSIKAGPCGTLNFDLYTTASNVKAISLISLPSFDALVNYTQASCPPVSPMEGVNASEWLRASWYVQQQQPTQYQEKGDLNCVVATYNQEDQKVPMFSGPVIAVHNYANLAKINGVPSNPDNKTVLCARQPDESDFAKLLVAPCFLPNKIAGDYWILAAGPSPDNYEWAVVTAGQPTAVYSDGCTTEAKGSSNGGLYIFTRGRFGTAEEIGFAHDALKLNGYTLSQLVSTVQQGCTYEGAFIKR